MFPFFELEEFLPEPDDRLGIGLGYGLVWCLLWGLYSAVGRGQQRNSGGTLTRLALVSALLAAATVFPGILVYGLGLGDDRSLGQVEFLVFINALLLIRYQLPFRPPGHAQLVAVESADVLASAERIAREMKIRTPRLRQFPGDRTSAWAYSLMQPTVALMEGVLYRLDSGERDAILAHEFAHFANLTLWAFAALKVFSVSVAAVTTSLPPGLNLVLGVVVFVGLFRITGRWFEVDCDRRAARVVGHQAVISGLEKIHALRGISNRGWWALLFDAVSSHPSRDVRLDELRRAAPEQDRITSAGDMGALRYHRLASWAATGIWLVTLIVGFAYAWSFPLAVAIVWLVIALFPRVLRLIVVGPGHRRHARRLGHRFRLARVALPVLVLALLGAAYMSTLWPTTVWLPAGAQSVFGVSLQIGLLLGALAALTCIPNDNVRNAIRGAVNSRDFQKALELARRNPRRVKRDVISRHNVALAHLGLGHRELAVQEFITLWETERFGFSGMWLAAVLLNENRSEEALRVADELAGVWTNDPAPPFLRSRALRRLGRVDEAETAATDAFQRFELSQGDFCALRAGIALDRGDLERAHGLILQAEQASPGGAFVLAIAAEIAQKGNDPGTAADAATKAIQALRRIPLPMFQFELEQLESTQSASVPEPGPPEALEITDFVRQE